MRSKIYEGSVIPFNVSLSKMGQFSMSQYDFEIYYYCSTNKLVKVEKTDAFKENDDNYIFFVDTRLTGLGQLRFAIKAIIPDTRLEGALRPDIIELDSGCDVVKSIIPKI